MADAGVKLSSQEEQARRVAEITTRVEHEAFQMKLAADGNNLKDVLKHASAMLHELRTGLLTPMSYYDLYMTVFDHLVFLERFIHTVHRNGKPMPELYQMVQHAGSILPRMYLLITVGAVFIKTREAPAKDILNDLVEMAKGVQHPTRGLFLRYFLSEMTKDKLPDLHSDYEGHGGTVGDAISFVLQNFSEMTRLWVRMQFNHAVRNRKKRERQRQELRVLVGSNVVRLSQMEGVDLPTYQKTVLPVLFEQVKNSKDKIAQFYIMEIMVVAFPAEFHIRTLQPYLEVCSGLLAGVDVKSLVCALMSRIADFARRTAAENPAAEPIPASVPAFDIFREFVDTLCVERKDSLKPVAVLELLVGLLDFTTQCYGDKLENVDAVLSTAARSLEELGTSGSLDAEATELVERLLKLPQQQLAMRVLDLPSYPSLMAALPFPSRRAIARSLLKAVLRARTVLNQAPMVQKLLAFLDPITQDSEGSPSEEEDIVEDFEEEQRDVARLMNLVSVTPEEEAFQILVAVRKQFGLGGTRRIPFTLPPLVFTALRLLRRLVGLKTDGAAAAIRRLLQFVHEICTALASSHPELAVSLFLQCALAADVAGHSYPFFSQAFVLAELLSSAAQARAVGLMVASIHATKRLSEANYDNLSTKVTQLSARLTLPQDQCRMICACASLFWKTEGHDFKKPKQAQECLKRSLMLADECMPYPSVFFVHILNQYLLLFNKGCTVVLTPEFLTTLLNLIREHIDAMPEGGDKATVVRHMANTKVYMRRLVATNPAFARVANPGAVPPPMPSKPAPAADAAPTPAPKPTASAAPPASEPAAAPDVPALPDPSDDRDPDAEAAEEPVAA